MENVIVIDKSHILIDAEQNLTNTLDESVFGEKMGLIAKLFGCWHTNISRPFKQGTSLYRSCLECGARIQFDPETLKTYGAFYYPPITQKVTHFV